MASDERSVGTEAAAEFLGTGRRKAAVAKVRLRAGEGKFLINGRAWEHYLCLESARREAISPLQCVALTDKFDVTATVLGGGIQGQAGALRLGIARALQKMDASLRSSLKKADHLSRDGRMKERKKSGQPGARKHFQFSKR